MKKVSGVELIRRGKGIAACPAGTLCLYTHADYNESETDGDVLSIAPDIQLNQAQLRAYGFVVDGRSGVSCVVNKMNKAGTLVSGADINGYTLRVAAGTNISDLMGVTYPGGGSWNDKTHSVVSAPVQEVILKINLENDIPLTVDETVETDLVIVNESLLSVEGATVEFVSVAPAVVEVGSFDGSVNIPSRNSATVRVPLTGRQAGNAQLIARLRMPVGLVNNGDTEKSSNAIVSKAVVNMRMLMAPQMEVTAGISLYYAPLEIRNLSDREIAGVVVESTSANAAVLTVGEFENIVTLPPNGSVRVNIPVNGIAAGNAVLTTKLSPPDNLVNIGDSQRGMMVLVHVRRDLRVDQSLLGKWKKVWDKPEFIYNYDLTLHSETIRVSRWRLTFILQQGAVLDPDWLETQKDWLEVDQALPGFVALINKAGRTIEPGTDLKLAVQVLYPGESDYYNELYNLHLRQLG